jgi:hypothetical protein
MQRGFLAAPVAFHEAKGNSFRVELAAWGHEGIADPIRALAVGALPVELARGILLKPQICPLSFSKIKRH